MVLTNLLVNKGAKALVNAGANLWRKLRDTRMWYLPIYPEKNWDQTVLWNDYWGPAWEWLPVTNTFLDASRWFSQFARQANNPLERGTDVIYWLGSLWGSVLVWPVVDVAWNLWNAAYNGYKRLYNYWANAYNNLADAHNNAIMQRQPEWVTMQAMQPVQYLWNQTFDRLNEQNLNAFRKLQVNASPAVITTNEWIAWNIAPASTQAVIANRMEEAKSKIVKALWDLAAGKQIATAAGKAKAKALIDLYNKIK